MRRQSRHRPAHHPARDALRRRRYLTRTQLKRPRVSDHALRHTAATLAYRYSHDLRAVQDLLGHSDPRTTASYARVVDMARTNPVLSVPVKL